MTGVGLGIFMHAATVECLLLSGPVLRARDNAGNHLVLALPGSSWSDRIDSAHL